MSLVEIRNEMMVTVLGNRGCIKFEVHLGYSKGASPTWVWSALHYEWYHTGSLEVTLKSLDRVLVGK